jgi:prepilin-type N-terminal cleavage/methylation domain-containing protein
MHKNTTRNKYNRGMTLVELLVVLAIFIIVAGITIFDYGRFRSTVSLQNLSDDIALSVRRAQGYAIGVESSLNTFSNGYGIHLSNVKSADTSLSGTSKSFVIFADIADGKGDRNKFYDYDPSVTSLICNLTTLQTGNECLDFLSITSNDQIIKICPNGDVNNCLHRGYVDITFIRPNPNAFIASLKSS